MIMKLIKIIIAALWLITMAKIKGDPERVREIKLAFRNKIKETWRGKL